MVRAEEPGETGYKSPWYVGPGSDSTPEPHAHQRWQRARRDWLLTSRPEDFERMLAAVTLDNPPLACEVQAPRRLCVTMPRGGRRDLVRLAAATSVAAVIATVLAVFLALTAILSLIGSAVNAGRSQAAWAVGFSHKSIGQNARFDGPASRPGTR